MFRPDLRSKQRLHPLALVTGLTLYACAPAATQSEPESAEGQAAFEPESSTGRASNEAASDVVRSGTASVFVMHTVSDFDAFLKFFEEGASERAAMGIRGHLLSRLDDGRVLIHFFADNVEQVEAGLNSERLQTYLERDGVPDASLVWLARDESVTMPQTPPARETFSLLLKLPVSDFSKFEHGYAERSGVFATHGVIARGLHRTVSDENVVILHLVASSRNQLEALSQAKEFSELLELAGNQQPPKLLFAADVARSRQ